jgi:hypothetical protein
VRGCFETYGLALVLSRLLELSPVLLDSDKKNTKAIPSSKSNRIEFIFLL